MRPGSSEWIVPLRCGPDAKVKLLCLHHSGGGAYGFAPLAAALARPGLDILGVQLPGRETRFGEAPIVDPDALLAALVEALGEHLDRPYILFGHSLGALVAYALAVHAQATGCIPCPSALIVSSAPPPSDRSAGPDAIDLVATASDDQLVAQLRQWGGTPAELLDQPGFRKIFLPVLRADCALAASLLRQTPLVALDGRLIAVTGDDEAALGARALGWGRVAKGAFSAHSFPGGHFYFKHHLAPLVAILENALDQAICGGGQDENALNEFGARM